MPLPSVDGENYEALLQFLYIAPVGLAQIRRDGGIVLLNPLCAQLLIPLSEEGGLENLFVSLRGVMPDLRHRVDGFEAVAGTVCDAVRLHVDLSRAGRNDMQVLSLSLLKMNSDCLMAVIDDVTKEVRRERALRLSQCWIHSLVSGVNDYARVTLDDDGRCLDWNLGVERVTGFTRRAVERSSFAIFLPPEHREGQDMVDRLREADQTGWSLEEGWRQHADGKRFWASCLVVPRQAYGELPSTGRSYSLIIRDITNRREAHEALRRSLHTDHLTGLSNRRMLFEAAELAFQH